MFAVYNDTVIVGNWYLYITLGTKVRQVSDDSVFFQISVRCTWKISFKNTQERSQVNDLAMKQAENGDTSYENLQN